MANERVLKTPLDARPMTDFKGNAPHMAHAKKHILLIEDDPEIRLIIAELLAYYGYELDTASNGQEALERLHRNGDAPCVILLDLMMPVMTGWEFLDRQQEDGDLRDIPVVIMSADQTALDQGHPQSVKDFLLKPVNFEKLLATVASYYH